MEPPVIPASPTAEYPPGTPAASSPRAEYEFSERDNQIFSALALRMNFVGLFSLATGIFTVVIGTLVEHPGSILAGALYAVIGTWTQRASVSFKNVAVTRGSDVSHLLLALQDLRKLYAVQFWICAIMTLTAVISLAILLYHRTLR